MSSGIVKNIIVRLEIIQIDTILNFRSLRSQGHILHTEKFLFWCTSHYATNGRSWKVESYSCLFPLNS